MTTPASTGTAALQEAAQRFLRGFGLVAAAWCAALALLQDDVSEPAVLWVGVGVVAAWSVVSRAIPYGGVWAIGWAVMALGAELLGPLAGTGGQSVAGGVPFVVLAAAALTGSRRLTAVVVVALSAAALLRGIVGGSDWPVSASLSTVLLFTLSGAALVGIVRTVVAAQTEIDRLRDRAAAAEREAAVARERAEAAARLHDRVLQTLTAIGRADDVDETTRLARRAGAELRDFLHRATSTSGGSLTDAVRSRVTQVADGRQVGVVAAGDAELDARTEVLVDAVGEAVANALRHGAPPVRVLLERESDRVVAWVVDSGEGFDPAQVPADRLGVRRSIVGRLEGVGGGASLVVADECEWELWVSIDPSG